MSEMELAVATAYMRISIAYSAINKPETALLLWQHVGTNNVRSCPLLSNAKREFWTGYYPSQLPP